MQGVNSLNDDTIKRITSKLRKDTLSYAPAILIPALINVVSVMIFTRIFSPTDYGIYSLILTTINLLCAVFSQWINQSIQIYKPQYKNLNKNEIFEKNLTLIILISMGMVSVIFISLSSYVKPLLGDYAQFYWISLGIIIAQCIYNIGLTNLQTDMQVKKYRNFQLLNSILKFIGCLVLLYFVSISVQSLLIGILVSLIILLIPLYKSIKLIKLSKSGSNSESFSLLFKKFLLYGVPMMGWFLGSSFLNMGNRYVLEAYHSSDIVGIFSANFNLVSTGIGLVCTPLLTAAHPIIMNSIIDREKDKEKAEIMISKFSKIYLYVAIPIIVIVAVFSKEISLLLLGEEYQRGAAMIPVMLLGLLAWNFSLYGHKGLELFEKSKLMLLFLLISAVVNMLFNFVLIPEWDLYGATIASLTGYLTYPILVYFSSKNYVKWNIPWLSLLKITTSSVLPCLLLFPLKFTFNYLGIHSILLMMSGFFIFVLIYLLSLEKFKEIDGLRKFINKIKKQRQYSKQ